MSTVKLNRLREIELAVQQLWEDEKCFDVDVNQGSDKYFITFPYPYMNGCLHLGHAFSFSKCEFAARFNRLIGLNVLFPFGFHCTGMPIAASADKIANEITDGILTVDNGVVNVNRDKLCDTNTGGPGANKSKILSKTGNAKLQSDILAQSGVPVELIPKFADPLYWLNYFPPIGMKDLKQFGAAVDWRRSFITTEANPYYDAFIKWQYRTLKSRGKLKFGVRPSVYSRIEEQPCADHDRASGEGVNPVLVPLYCAQVSNLDQSVTSVINKLKLPVYVLVTLPTNGFLNDASRVNVFTNNKFYLYYGFKKIKMPGEPLCDKFVAKCELSEEQVKSECDVLYICNEPCALNLSYQGRIPIYSNSNGKMCAITKVSCESLALCTYTIISNDVRYNIEGRLVKVDKQVLGSGLTATCDNEKINEFETNNFISNLITNDDTFSYYETETQVVSRSGDNCVVALCNQWYINYNDQQWKQMVVEHVNNPDSFNSHNMKAAYLKTIAWLDDWAFSRNYGLGTRVEWDDSSKQMLIESLSDSTIYFAYYTICHMLHSDIFGKEQGSLNIKAEDLKQEEFDYIYCQTDQYSAGRIPLDKMKQLRESFMYWYPMDLRCSGKDLVPNHLTMSLFHHAAIWPNHPEYWPRAFFVNGHIMLDSAKMSKQTGNFLTIQDSIDKFGVDSTRIVLADAGDSCEDANFEQTAASNNTLKLYNLLMFAEEFSETFKPSDYTPQFSEIDEIFITQIDILSAKVKTAYTNLMYREAVKNCFYELIALKDKFKIIGQFTETISNNAMYYWFRTLIIILSPIAPHICEHIWRNCFKFTDSVTKQKWPTSHFEEETMAVLALKYNLVIRIINEIRTSQIKASKKMKGHKPTKAILGVAEKHDELRSEILRVMSKSITSDAARDWKSALKDDEYLSNVMSKDRKSIGMIMEFASFAMRNYESSGVLAFLKKLPFSERQLYEQFSKYISYSTGLELEATDCEASNVFPRNPSVNIV